MNESHSPRHVGGQPLVFRVSGFGFQVSGSGFRVQGLGLGTALVISAENCWSRKTVRPSLSVSWNQSLHVTRFPVQLWKYS